MEEHVEKQVWQRVRGNAGPEPAQLLRQWLTRQGALWTFYRTLSRRGGSFRVLFEQKDRQIACLRGLLRLQTGQSAARPSGSDPIRDLAACYEPEARFLEELTANPRDPALAALADAQKKHLYLLLELLGRG